MAELAQQRRRFSRPRVREVIQRIFARIIQVRPVTVIRQLWPFLTPERWRLLDATLTMLLLTTVEVASPVLVGIFVDAMLGMANNTIPALSWWHYGIIALLGLGALIRGYLIARQDARAGDIGERVAARIRNKLWAHVLHVPIEYLRRRGPGRLSLRFISDTRMVQRLVTQGMIRASQDIVLIAAILVVLLLINWRMGLGVVVVLPIYAVIFHRLNPKLRKESRATRRRRSRLSAYLHDHLSGVVAIKASARHAAENARMRSMTRSLAKRGARRVAIGGQVRGVAAGTVAASGVLVLALAASELATGRLTGGSFVTFYTLLGLLVPAFQRIANANRYFQEASISMERLMQTLAVPPECPSDDDRPALQIADGSVTVASVSFAYTKAHKALNQVSLKAQRGQIVALVGPNGSGKSSLLDLIVGLQKPSEGHILIDGQETTQISLASLRTQIGLVSQNAPLFDGTIAENIAYGLPDEASEAQIHRAAELAGVDRFVDTLPKGWDTNVGQGGRALSGGQRQLVALARSLIADPPILILDEATSALDTDTEQMLTTRLRELAQHKTVIVSAHRLPTLIAADWIYVLEQGYLVESGSHDTLITMGGLYARLFGEHNEE